MTDNISSSSSGTIAAIAAIDNSRRNRTMMKLTVSLLGLSIISMLGYLLTTQKNSSSSRGLLRNNSQHRRLDLDLVSYFYSKPMLHYYDPKSTNIRTDDPNELADGLPAPPKGVAASQWCRDPETDPLPAPPIDYNNCESSQLIHMDINGGMTSQLNKILKVAIWAAMDNSCFYINEEMYGSHFAHSKLGYREFDNGKEEYWWILDRYFDQMGIRKPRWEYMMDTTKGKQFDMIDPGPGEIAQHDFGGKGSLTSNDPKQRFRLRSIPSLGYIDVDNISLKKHFLRRMFRIKQPVRDMACEHLTSQGLANDDYMALSIRRGDKVTETAVLETVDPYIKEAEKAIELYFGGAVPTMFVATDDCAVMQEFRDQRPDWTFVSECDNATEENGFVYKEMKHWTEEQTDAHFHKFIAEMIGMASAKHWIGVPTTNVSYWIYFMRPLDAHDENFVWVEKPRNDGMPW